MAVHQPTLNQCRYRHHTPYSLVSFGKRPLAFIANPCQCNTPRSMLNSAAHLSMFIGYEVGRSISAGKASSEASPRSMFEVSFASRDASPAILALNWLSNVDRSLQPGGGTTRLFWQLLLGSIQSMSSLDLHWGERGDLRTLRPTHWGAF